MKKMISTVILAVMAVMAFSQTESNETYQRLTGIPKPPVAGTTISFEYHPQGGPLEGMKDLVALVYMYRDYRWTLADTALADNGNGSWSGSLLIPTDCAFMAFQFQSTWDQFTQTKDNNDNQGFLYVMSDDKGQPLPGGNLAWGMMRKPGVGLGVGNYFNDGYKDIEQDALYFWYQKEIQQYKDGVERAEQAAKQAITEFNGVNEILSQVKEDLNSEREENSEERLYKNEAYAFILSEGLLDKFLDFREPLHRTRSQEIHYTLTTASDLPGEWVAE